MRDNNLIGEIPSEFGQLSSLEELDISLNNLSGEIPSELGNISTTLIQYFLAIASLD